MKMQMRYNLSILLLVIIFQTVSNNCKSEERIQNTVYRNYTDIIIGSKINDSTGKVTITNSQIQQNLVSVIPLISHSTILNTQPFISVGSTSTYLIFQVTSAPGDTMNVAVGLTVSANNLSFGLLTEIHLCKANANCITCGFAMDNDRKIIGCYVKKSRKVSGDISETYLIKD